MTIANWLTTTRRPRKRAGANSAIYIGDTVEASPTPIPPTNRQTLKSIMPRASALPMADAMNRAADNSNALLRPKRSASQTPANGPNGQPRIALPVTAPTQNGERLHSAFKKIIAPEISDRS